MHSLLLCQIYDPAYRGVVAYLFSCERPSTSMSNYQSKILDNKSVLLYAYPDCHSIARAGTIAQGAFDEYTLSIVALS